AYGHKRLKFGPEYIIPKPFDSRVLFWVAPAVAEAALRSGVARDSIDIEDYRNRLYRQLSPARRVLWNITEAAKSSPCRIVYPEGDHENIIRAARRVADANIAQPILLGVPERILSRARAAGISLDGVSLVDPRRDLRLERYAHHY